MAKKRKASKSTIMVSIYLTPELKQALDKLSKATRIQRAVLVREAIEDLLFKYHKGPRQKRDLDDLFRRMTKLRQQLMQEIEKFRKKTGGKK